MPRTPSAQAAPPTATRPATPAARARELERFRARVYRLVALIPPGRVATYGQLAALAGHPRRSRHVGNALKHHPGEGLPWHRVLNAQGKVAPRGGESRPRGDEPVERRQVRLLEAEGVHFIGGRVDLERYRWRPESEGGTLVRGLRARVSNTGARGRGDERQGSGRGSVR